MLWEDNYLAHYGIYGQRWGVRRFQNKDGSLTAEGKVRYGLPKDPKAFKEKFKEVTNSIKENCSNSVQKFDKKPINVDRIKDRGKLTKKEAEQCAELAQQVFEDASKNEPKITKDVVAAIKESGSEMYGLDNRLKQPTSIASKIGSDAKERNCSFEEAASSLKDAIRYTSVSDDSKFTDNYYYAKHLLESKGYIETRCRNYFALYKGGKVRHKSVQCVYIDPNGVVFEVQFQTPSSQAAKELKTPLYEERRQLATSESRKAEIEKQMIDLAEQVGYPKNIMRIKSYG